MYSTCTDIFLTKMAAKSILWTPEPSIRTLSISRRTGTPKCHVYINSQDTFFCPNGIQIGGEWSHYHVYLLAHKHQFHQSQYNTYTYIAYEMQAGNTAGTCTHSCNNEEVKDSTAVPPGIGITIFVLTLIWRGTFKRKINSEIVYLVTQATIAGPTENNNTCRQVRNESVVSDVGYGRILHLMRIP